MSCSSCKHSGSTDGNQCYCERNGRWVDQNSSCGYEDDDYQSSSNIKACKNCDYSEYKSGEYYCSWCRKWVDANDYCGYYR